MRRGKVVVDGKIVNLTEAEVLYADGRFRGSRGVTLYRTPKASLVWSNWSNCQGEDDTYEMVSPAMALELLQHQRHPERVAKAIEELGLMLEEA